MEIKKIKETKKTGIIEKILFSRTLMKDMYGFILCMMVLLPAVPVYFLNVEDETKTGLYIVNMLTGLFISIVCMKYLAKKRNKIFENETMIEGPEGCGPVFVPLPEPEPTRIDTIVTKNRIDY